MKKSVLIYIILAVFLAGSVSAAEEIFLKIPVWIYKEGAYLTGLQAEDFTLKINGKTRPVEKLLTGSRSINDISERRNFILQFNLTDYGKNITTGIDFFINETSK